MDDGKDKTELSLYYLLIALAPAIVFAINQFVLSYLAEPFDLLPERLAEFDVYKESAARIGMLAAFMLFIGAASAALAFFGYTLQRLDWPARGVPSVAFVALAVGAVLAGDISRGRDAYDYVGKSLACLAVGYDREQSAGARAGEIAALRRSGTAQGTPPGSAPLSREQVKGVAVEHLENRRNCAHDRFARLQQLANLQFLATVLAFSALVSGAICCLAERPALRSPKSEPNSPAVPADSTAASAPSTDAPSAGEPAPQTAPDPSGADNPDLVHWERQSERLNTCLYLAALLLGTGLLFINAYLRGPAFALMEAEPYEANVAALVSYYGFTFTVMLAAFYIPAATILASKVRGLKTPVAAGESKLPDAFKGPLQILKIVLGLFSTALAGVLPGILELIA